MFKGCRAVVRRGDVWHWGILDGLGGVIETAGKDGGGGQRVSVDEFGRGRTIYVLPFDAHFSPEEVVRRAIRAVTSAEYAVLTNNCEHNTSWAATGSHSSEQVFHVVLGAAALAAFAALATKSSKHTVGAAAVGALLGYLTIPPPHAVRNGRAIALPTSPA